MESGNVREVEYDGGDVEVKKRVAGGRTYFELTPLLETLHPGGGYEFGISFKSSDMVELFSGTGLWNHRDINRIGDIPDIPAEVLDEIEYPAFTVAKSMEYRTEVHLPEIKPGHLEELVVDEWHEGTGNPDRQTKAGKIEISYAFNVEERSAKSYAVLFGTRPKSVKRLVAEVIYILLGAAVIVSVLIAISIAFFGLDPVAGWAIILGLIGGETALKWIERAEKL